MKLLFLLLGYVIIIIIIIIIITCGLHNQVANNLGTLTERQI